MRTVVVTGTRNLHDPGPVYDALFQEMMEARDIGIKVVEGGATGVDDSAKAFALDRGVPRARYPADWKEYGKAAGSIRNAKMLDSEQPDVVLAFPSISSKGTWDCIYKAVNRNIQVVIYPV